MRFSELRGLFWSDVDWIKGTIKVCRQIQDIPGKGSQCGSPKSYAGTRTILLGEKSLAELREQKQIVEENKRIAGLKWKDSDLIFPSIIGTPFVSMSLQHDFKGILRMAGLPNIRFHDLRHTAASLMLSHGVPALVVSKMLGHSNPSITLSIYAHSTVEMQSLAVGVMDTIVTPIPVSIPQLHPSAPDGKK
jgi:integrase